MSVALQAPHRDFRDRTLFEAGDCAHLHVDMVDAAAAGNFLMFDDVTASLIPSTAHAAAYYVGGPFANYNSIRAQLPRAILAPTMLRSFSGSLKTINDWQHGVSWDIEPSLFTAADAGQLVRQTRAEGVFPHLYCPLSWAAAVCASVHAAGFAYDDFGLHTAHWTGQAHICSGISTVFGVVTAKATQFTDTYLGRSLDASLCAPGWLGHASHPHPRPRPEQDHPSGQMRADVIVDWDKPVGHRLSISGAKGTWRRGKNQPPEVMQIHRAR